MNTARIRSTSRTFVALGVITATLLAWVYPAVAAEIDPQATKLLKASLDLLAAQKQFTIESRSTLEVVLTSGQKLQFDHTAKQAFQRPDRMRAERTGDLVDQVFYYDGKSLTLHNPRQKYYATVAAPGTIEGMLDFAREKLDIVAPAGDLIYRDAYQILMTDVESGFVVGAGMVEGVRCTHLAFRAPHVDWQVWIQDGAKPLPMKFVITTRDQPNAPQFEVVVTKWDLAPRFDARTFTFTPPKGAQKVDFLPLGSGRK